MSAPVCARCHGEGFVADADDCRSIVYVECPDCHRRGDAPLSQPADTFAARLAQLEAEIAEAEQRAGHHEGSRVMMFPHCLDCGAEQTAENHSPSAAHCDKCFAAIWREKRARHANDPTPVDPGTARALRILDDEARWHEANAELATRLFAESGESQHRASAAIWRGAMAALAAVRARIAAPTDTTKETRREH